ncbi:MAG TPA: hypothetical protein VK205_08945 [Prolixibacteraceae bacterium]|nr:hypothetical protein [Prolixibacteraceae bacterium]
MKDINIKEIIDLATQDVVDPDAELKKVYDWYNERKIMIIKGTLSIAVSLIITLAIAYYKSEIKVDKWMMIFPLFFSLLSMTYGIYELSILRKIGKKYIAAITLLNRLKKIKPFLTLYRNVLNR